MMIRWVAIFLLASFVSVSSQAQTEVRVMSFNIRYGTANDGEDHFAMEAIVRPKVGR